MFEIEDPYVTYQINVTVQQLSFMHNDASGREQKVWSTIGNAVVGPERIGQNTNANQDGTTSGPMVS